MPSTHNANEQKFNVLMVSRCRIHGALGDVGASIGSIVFRSLSSEGPRCHTMSLLSLPCLMCTIILAMAVRRQRS